ncbi:MAG: homoserine kinase [Tepidimonas sp.]|uniref:homoserine kinase n=1 Tax=Tepidimonas sp. TaxID=2002775 RepID=UPI00298F22CC|nr:homoserine kinase [Tepidimonas sp.]MDW8337293.1 homoserine kinase [Tepidimonas sp.]
MAVFTEVSRDEAAALMQRLGLGALVEMTGCAGGIENTNYFVSTERDGQRLQWVLTLFERLTHEQLPFYLHLMKHLADKGIPVPDPQADASGAILHTVRGKPAAVVNRLRGCSVLDPGPEHCAQVGVMLARMHLAAQDYPRQQPNLRGLAWWNETVPVVLPHLQPTQAELLRDELAYQNTLAASAAFGRLPRGPVHADLFRDNVMFEDGRLSGVFDFYFAGCDTWLFDLAVALNDWCIDLASGAADAQREQALLQAYQTVRALTDDERLLLPALRRAAALRFWISRLWDWYLPRPASMLKPHDPTHFERVLLARRREAGA